MIRKVGSPAQAQIALGLIRIIVGVIFFAHGYQKFFAMGIEGTTGFFTQVGAPLPGISAIVVASLELVGGLSLVAGFIARNITDDFLFRSNAKELWAMTAFLLGYGMRREQILAAGDVPTQGRMTGAKRGVGHEFPASTNASAPSAHGDSYPAPTAGAAPAAAVPPSPPHRQSESA